MSKRFGRNQRRQLRAENERLQARSDLAVDELQMLGERYGRKDRQVKDWARRIVARLSQHSAFALDKSIAEWNGQSAMMIPLPGPMVPIDRRMEVYAESFTQDLIQMFVHHVESTYDKYGGREMKGQLVLHLYRGKDHEPLYIALSAQQMDEMRYTRDDQYMDFLVRGLARQLAKHAEEIRHGR